MRISPVHTRDFNSLLLGYSCLMEHKEKTRQKKISKQLSENVFEKNKTGGEYEKISKSLNVPPSAVTLTRNAMSIAQL